MNNIQGSFNRIVNNPIKLEVIKLIYPHLRGSTSPVVMLGGNVKENDKHNRCNCDGGPCSSYNHGKSYMAFDYNHGKGPGKYDIIITVQRYGEEYYGTDKDAWYRFQHAPSTYTGNRTPKLGGPGAPGREFYFFNGNNQTPGLRTGAIGVEIFHKNAEESFSWALWYLNDGFPSLDWGREWYRCGQDYQFWFEDA
ncbi:hypothetical protein bthur0013_56540 [Bacillus thuringiensis IBL 200]|nr:hypothetical protein bthur0013_56540 [Bacillus thuringiensis IBL 200]MCR6866563.1 hypothetical protein [Bacillus thuringiensis]MED3220629.1 hypothetical protein [Bacillus thuringiensis]